METPLSFDRLLLSELAGVRFHGPINTLCGVAHFPRKEPQKLSGACFGMLRELDGHPEKLDIYIKNTLTPKLESVFGGGTWTKHNLELLWAEEIKSLGFLDSVLDIQSVRENSQGQSGTFLKVSFDCGNYQGHEIFFAGDFLRWIQDWPLEVLHYFYLKQLVGEKFNPWQGIVASFLSISPAHQTYGWMTSVHSFFDAIVWKNFNEGWGTAKEAIESLRNLGDKRPFKESNKWKLDRYISQYLSSYRQNRNIRFDVVGNSDEVVTKFVTSVGNQEELDKFIQGEENGETSSGW